MKAGASPETVGHGGSFPQPYLESRRRPGRICWITGTISIEIPRSTGNDRCMYFGSMQRREPRPGPSTHSRRIAAASTPARHIRGQFRHAPNLTNEAQDRRAPLLPGASSGSKSPRSYARRRRDPASALRLRRDLLTLPRSGRDEFVGRAPTRRHRAGCGRFDRPRIENSAQSPAESEEKTGGTWRFQESETEGRRFQESEIQTRCLTVRLTTSQQFFIACPQRTSS